EPAVAYLPPELHRMVGHLGARQRTPVFTIGTTWSRHTWYLRLPGPDGSPWSGIVRCECSSDLAPAAAIVLANAASAALPRFASEPHKDTRAPRTSTQSPDSNANSADASETKPCCTGA